MDEMQNDMAQKFDNIQYSISRLTNLNTVQEKENSPSQPYQNSMSIHEMEAQEGESSMLEHKVESETEKEKREEIKGKKKGKSIEKDGYDGKPKTEENRAIRTTHSLVRNSHHPTPLCEIAFESIASNGARFGVETKKLWPFEDDCAKLNGNVAAAPISLLLDTFLEHFLELKLFRSPVLQTVCDLDLKRRSYGHLKESNFAFGRLQLRAPVEETMPSKENTRTEAKVLIQPTQKATTDASAPQDLTII
ncbi:hypothetical protein AAG906_017426 [Vitis piasezkii]